MQRKYDGDSARLHFQMDRFYSQNSEWFYMTREGQEKGPFPSKQDANGDLIDYIQHKHKMEQFGV